MNLSYRCFWQHNLLHFSRIALAFSYSKGFIILTLHSLRFQGLTMNKFISLHLILFICIFGIFLWIVDSSRISQRINYEVLDLFPDNDNRALIEAHRHFANSKYIPLALRGFDESSKKRFETLLSQVEKIPNIASISQFRPSQQQQLYDFLTNPSSYLLTPDSNSQADLDFTQMFAPILHTFQTSYTSQTLQDFTLTSSCQRLWILRPCGIA